MSPPLLNLNMRMILAAFTLAGSLIPAFAETSTPSNFKLPKGRSPL